MPLNQDRLKAPKPIQDLEGIQIGIMLHDIEEDIHSPKHIDLEAIGLKANLYSMIVIDQEG